MYNLTVDYHWYVSPEKKSEIIKIYKINGISYSYDKIPEIGQNDPELINIANKNKGLDDKALFYGSYYLMEEMMHPLLFALRVDYPELLPSD
jgi:hypothetical protein